LCLCPHEGFIKLYLFRRLFPSLAMLLLAMTVLLHFKEGSCVVLFHSVCMGDLEYGASLSGSRFGCLGDVMVVHARMATDPVRGVCFNPSCSFDMLDCHCSLVTMSWPGLSPSQVFFDGHFFQCGSMVFCLCGDCSGSRLSFTRWR